MLRAARLIGSGRGAVRVPVRRRLATEASPATPAPKKKHIVRRFVLYSTGAVTAFYVGSAFVAFSVPQYHDFFIENVPLGTSFIQFTEDNEWDTLSVEKVIEASSRGIAYVQSLINSEQAGKVVEKAKDAAERTKEASRSVAKNVKTTVSKVTDELPRVSKKDVAVAKHQANEFSEGVEELVRRAEDAIAGKPVSKSDVQTTPTQPETAPQENTAAAAEASTSATKAKNVYNAPLPLGFEPPPGYTKPAPSKPPSTSKDATPAEGSAASPSPPPEPLPLVAPAVKEFAASEPMIAQLATVIDDLASYLNTNPAAANRARDVLDTAKVDLTQLAARIEQVKEQERQKLEITLDEQTREYTIKLLEMEMEAQDKLDSQEDGFRKFFEQEKQKFVQAYREKLNQELQTQSEIINERLKEEVIAQGIEMQRRWIREIKMRVEQERGGRLAKIDELSTSLKRLERIALDNSAYLDENLRIHALWSAIRAVSHAVDGPVRKPFRDELRVLRHIAAAREDTVVTTALDTLEATDVPDIGVEPLVDLTSWFTTSVAPRVANVALVPDQDGGLLSHLASHFLSAFTFKRQGLVPGEDVLSVLARAEHYMNEKDLDSAARELNQLTGTAKVLITDWLVAARRRLEVLQALEVVQTQATLASLLVSQD
ncbi:hypothetical protein PHLGIDRAFT_101187 [Phlebiopsis gigantea 11061_1 CR5-6]|uniref:MICOS complex subunit MIC60 n=1 Tax=Phlebiopsis gigantea (strain 11061_1 CR5-6) TaxID=745531 RepID=A0A0C3SEH6_PHLG1|nr:hypothetical protein PHLGIDRAFT_101187 [Phlebiopsis gigantea 11061_1 CR5-6]